MDKFPPKAFLPLDKEEQDLMVSLESNDWQPVANFEEEKEKAETAARHTIKKKVNQCLTSNTKNSQ